MEDFVRAALAGIVFETALVITRAPFEKQRLRLTQQRLRLAQQRLRLAQQRLRLAQHRLAKAKDSDSNEENED